MLDAQPNQGERSLSTETEGQHTIKPAAKQDINADKATSSSSEYNQQPNWQYSNQPGQSLKEIKGRNVEPIRKDIDAHRTMSSKSEYYRQHINLHDSKHWPAGTSRVHDSKSGSPEGKLSCSCSKAGRKNAVEEPLRRSRSLDPASIRLTSGAMHPFLLSKLADSQNGSEHSTFGLHLPGELGAQASDIARLSEDEISQDFGTIFFDETPIKVNAGLEEWSMRNFGDSSSDEKQYCDFVEEELPEFKEEMDAGNTAKGCKEDGLASDDQLVSSQVEGMQRGESMDTDNSSNGLKEDARIWPYEQLFSSQIKEAQRRETDSESSSNTHKENDIWSYCRVKGFPPPISVLANIPHPGLPAHTPTIPVWRSAKRDGRFVLQKVEAQSRVILRAKREFGRLQLQLVTVRETEENSIVAKFLASLKAEDEAHLAENSDTSKAEDNVSGFSSTQGSETDLHWAAENLAENSDTEIVHNVNASGSSSTQGIGTDPLWAAEKSARSGVAFDYNRSGRLVGELMSSTSLPKMNGSTDVQQGKTPVQKHSLLWCSIYLNIVLTAAFLLYLWWSCIDGQSFKCEKRQPHF